VEITSWEITYKQGKCVFAGVYYGVNEVFALLGCDTALFGSYRPFGTAYPSHLQWPSLPIRLLGPWRCWRPWLPLLNELIERGRRTPFEREKIVRPPHLRHNTKKSLKTFRACRRVQTRESSSTLDRSTTGVGPPLITDINQHFLVHLIWTSKHHPVCVAPTFEALFLRNSSNGCTMASPVRNVSPRNCWKYL
jgi:hypothetical protein